VCLGDFVAIFQNKPNLRVTAENAELAEKGGFILQNKANLWRARMSLSVYYERVYINEAGLRRPGKQSQPVKPFDAGSGLPDRSKPIL